MVTSCMGKEKFKLKKMWNFKNRLYDIIFWDGFLSFIPLSYISFIVHLSVFQVH